MLAHLHMESFSVCSQNQANFDLSQRIPSAVLPKCISGQQLCIYCFLLKFLLCSLTQRSTEIKAKQYSVTVGFFSFVIDSQLLGPKGVIIIILSNFWLRNLRRGWDQLLFRKDFKKDQRKKKKKDKLCKACACASDTWRLVCLCPPALKCKLLPSQQTLHASLRYYPEQFMCCESIKWVYSHIII